MMTPDQLIHGLEDIAKDKIPLSCIYDMIPEIIEYLRVKSDQTDNNQDEQHRDKTQR